MDQLSNLRFTVQNVYRGKSQRACPALASSSESIRGSAQRILQPDTYKDRMARMWLNRGPTYDSSDTFHRALATKLVEMAGIGHGRAVLDVATGTGMVAIPLAERVGSAGNVVGVDISESMLAEARRKAETLKLNNLQLICADIESTHFECAAFDNILCSSAMLYIQNLNKMFSQFLAWLKPGGKLCFNTPQEPCVPATAVFYDLLAEVTGVHLADAAAPLATAEIVRTTCLERGFSDVTVTTSREAIKFRNAGPKEYAEKIWASLASSSAIMTPLNGTVSQDVLDQQIKPRYLSEVAAMAASWEVADGIENPYTMLWAVAEKAG